MRVQRHTTGSVRFDRRRGTWNYLWYEAGKRRSKLIGTKQQYPTKAAAWKAVERFGVCETKYLNSPMMRDVIARYQAERMPSRHSTSYVYRSFLKNHIVPRWGETPIAQVQARDAELWLNTLKLSPKSKTHVRSLLHSLIEFAMWAGILEPGRNPISLVRNKGAVKRVRRARSLTVEEFHALLEELHEPFATLALTSVCLGLRISEALALRWSDVDWLSSRLNVQRGIVQQHVDECKTEGSARSLPLSQGLLIRLQTWKQASQFKDVIDWIFASPFQMGKLPYSYTGTRQELVRAGEAAGIGSISTHAFRHTYRSWLDMTGAPIATQQRLMRHTDIRVTMNVYGTVFDEAMIAASAKVSALALTNGAQAERESR